ncbi:zinc finger protein ZXDC isoform X1 [Synchiropus splendidus]|uniref:zinc finger protein ZXDC isoform X1 n=1 Tax=Synchiropus splendidus TaxID=270530 RepID=UPI00237E5123|nr:zinc finger protein ZXDC isoform X1 [Synchiropus splendidus]
MEIQGLPDAQNIHSQHGVLLDRTSPHAQPKSWSASRLISNENETASPQQSARPESDANNNRPTPPPPHFCLLAKDGSETSSTADCKQGNETEGCVIATLGDVNTETVHDSSQLFGLYEFATPLMRNEAVLLNALPVEGAREATVGRQREDGSNVRASDTAATRSCTMPTRHDRNAQGVYVVLNVFKDEKGTDHDDFPSKIGIIRHVTEERRFETVDTRINVVLSGCTTEPSDSELRSVNPIFHLPDSSNGNSTVADRTAEGLVLSGKTDRGMSIETKGNELAERGRLISETSHLLQDIGTPDLIADQGGSASLTDSASPTTCDAFSGTVTINNQSITVNVENGILSLAAPVGTYVQKESTPSSKTDSVHFTHVGGSKANGQLSALSITSLSPNSCSLSAMHHTVDPCSIVKQEDGVTIQSRKLTLSPCDDANVKTLSVFRSKKDAVTSFSCPEPACSLAFDSRQKLKVHLLTHADDPRPYQCSVEGCGWTFTTSYKLKRHLLSHDKQRPHTCQFEGCGRCFSTVYNLKAHFKVHVQDHGFICDVCSEKFRSATRLASHQRIHFEPQRPYKCEFSGCERTFITFSALFSHKRTHFKEMGDFTCTYPGCSKTYDKACRLKIHLRSHTGERPFICDSAGCGWSFTSMSKLLRHKRKHDDDRRFVCKEEGCGKSFTRAEHLKGHSITHLGTKPFQCHTEGCNARFSARSSLYIHSKKHKQDANSLKTPCPVSNCSKYFSSRSSLKSHMLKHHNMSSDVLMQMETMPTLTPSNELITSSHVPASTSTIAKGDQFTNLDLSSLFSNISGGTSVPASIGVGIPINGSTPKSFYRMDLSMASSGIISIDPSTVRPTLGSISSGTGTKPMESLALSSTTNMGSQRALEASVGDILLTQDTLNLDDVQMITSLGTLTALTIQTTTSTDSALQIPLGSSSAVCVEPPTTVAVTPVSELLTQTSKVVDSSSGSLVGAKVDAQYVVPTQSSSCPLPTQSEMKARSPPNLFLEGGGSARTDYRAIQLAKKNKQNGPPSSNGRVSQRKTKGEKTAPFAESASASSVGPTLRDPVAGAQYVQIQLLQDDPTPDGDLAFQLTSQPSTSHTQLTTDLPVHILQEPTLMTEENGLDNSQFTGSTINLQDLE